MKHSAKLTGTACVIALLAAATAFGLPRADPERTPRGFELRPGVLVDPDQSIVYASHPEGGIEAIDLTSGRLVWHDRRAAVPLLLYGELLIAWAESPEAGDILEITALDVSRRSAVLTARLELPAGARAVVDDRLGHSFSTSAEIAQGDVVVSWQDSRRPVRALLEAGTTDGARALAGAAVLDLEAEQFRPLPGGRLTVNRGRSPDLPPEQRLPGLDGVQLSSADGRHVMTRRRVADDRTVAKWEWSLYSAPDGSSIGRARQAASYAPFGVVGTLLLHEARPSIHRQDGELVPQPLGLQVVDLRRGAVVWKRPVRDTAYRGPLPP